MKKILIFIVFALTHAISMAGTASGPVTFLLIHASNVLMFQVGAAQVSPPSCSTLSQWAIPLDTTVGKSMYAFLLNAQAQGSNVVVIGTGDCSAWPDREYPRYVYTQ